MKDKDKEDSMYEEHLLMGETPQEQACEMLEALGIGA